MAANLRSLDVPHPQVLIDFFGDEHFHWHHRLLVVELAPGKWACVTPDRQVETVTLTDHRVLPLRRHGPFPERAHDNMYIFDPIDDQEMINLQRECLELARVLGVTNATVAAGVTAGDWRISDPARDDFAEKVEDADMASLDRAVVKDGVGLVCRVDADGASKWVTVERVKPSDVETWKHAKQSGPGRDARIASNLQDPNGVRFATLSQSMSVYRDQKFTDWPFRGPKAIKEFLAGVQKSGQELTSYDLFWASRSGIVRQSAVANAHRNVMTTLALLQSYDQYDLYNSAAGEFLARWALMIQSATRKNPKAPSFSGLETFLSHSFDECGGVVTSDFAKFIAGEQKDEAQIMKQHRLWQEEQAADEKGRGKTGKGDGKAAAAGSQ